MSTPIKVGIGDERPRIGGEIENSAAIGAPVLLVKRDFKPRGSGSTSDVVNADDFARRRGRPIGIALWSAVDCFVVDVDQFRCLWTVRIKTEDLGPAVLNSRTCRSADPLVPSDDDSHIAERVA